MDTNMRELIMNEAKEAEIEEASIAMGCHTLMRSGLQKVESGLTTLEEVLKIALDE